MLGKRKPQKLREKVCAFPGCDTVFMGRGKAKYCEEHRKSIYRKELYKKDESNTDGILVLDHNEVYAKTIIHKCSLEGCNNTYEIILLPRLYVYSNFCEEHRNEYKRKVFIELQERLKSLKVVDEKDE